MNILLNPENMIFSGCINFILRCILINHPPTLINLIISGLLLFQQTREKEPYV